MISEYVQTDWLLATSASGLYGGSWRWTLRRVIEENRPSTRIATKLFFCGTAPSSQASKSERRPTSGHGNSPSCLNELTTANGVDRPVADCDHYAIASYLVGKPFEDDQLSVEMIKRAHAEVAILQ